MELDQLRNAYTLRQISVDPRRLVLDPHNPRISLLLNDPYVLRPGTNIASDAVQTAVYKVLNLPVFALEQLVSSIRQKGFLNDGSQMIVKKFSRNGDFLVVEGNRRTAAIRYLRSRPELMTHMVRESVRSIDVQEFSYIPDRTAFSERDVIEMILGQIHISGKLSWGAMERAEYIYQSYCRVSDIPAGELLTNFTYLLDCSRRVAETFSCSVHDVRKSLIIARNYLLLRSIGASITPHHFTLIDLAVSTRAVNDWLFAVDPNYFHFSRSSARRFANLCVEENRIVTNPKDFRVVAGVAASGDKDFLDSVTSRAMTLAEAEQRLNRVAHREQFERQLDRALEMLKTLPVEAFRGNLSEKKLIRDLVTVVDKHLKPLL
jgi:hypothetical protein